MMDSLWMVFMSASVVLKGLQGAFPHAAHTLSASLPACLPTRPARWQR